MKGSPAMPDYSKITRRLGAALLSALIAHALSIAASPQTGSAHSGALQHLASARHVAPQASSEQNEWEGTYTFTESGGRTAGGSGIAVEHTLVIYRRGGELLADLDAAGFQTSVSLRCEARVAGDRLTLYFRSYREENISEPYRPGQMLLALERSAWRGRTRLLTHWGAYRPLLARARSGRVYFRRSR